MLRQVLQSLVVALVFVRLDFGTVTLAGLTKQLLDCQAAVHGARLIFSSRRRDYVHPLLCSLH